MQDGGDDLAEQYQGVLGTLRMLGKFLGFLEARSYSCEDTLSEELQEVQFFLPINLCFIPN